MIRTLAPLGRRAIHAAVRRAVHTSLARTDFRIVQLEVRRSRLELVVEADDHHALARGMQGFQVAAARRINRRLARRGAVFPDRYRARILRTRAAVRAALSRSARAEAGPGAHTRRIAWPHTWLLRVELERLRPRPPP